MDADKDLKKILSKAAREGQHLTLYAYLYDLSRWKINKLVNETLYEFYSPDQHCTLLMIASAFGCENVVKMLLSEFNADLEKEGIFKLEELNEGVCPLWCAASVGCLNIVKLLVEAGADVNHQTRKNSTPLRIACFYEEVDIVKYLIEHNADVNIPNTHNSTCLILAALKGNLDLVSILLENNADPNVQAQCGATALYYAAGNGHLSIVKKLLDHNTIVSVNNTGTSPIKAAALRTHSEVVEYLLIRPEISKEEKIEALELLGASYANFEHSYCIEKTYEYLHQAMKMRYNDPDNVIEKKLTEPVSAYENWIESRNLLELEALQNSPNRLHMEALMIHQRILGKHDPDLPDSVVYRGSVFADNNRFDRCIELYSYAIHLRQLNKESTAIYLLYFAEVFSRMIYVGVEVTYDNIVQVLNAAIVELKQNKSKIATSDSESIYGGRMESSLTATLYFLTISTKLLNKFKEEERLNLYRIVSTLNHLQVKFNDGMTLLHLACLKYHDYPTEIESEYIEKVCRYSCAETVRLLIECGAEVNVMDSYKNTPFHMLVAEFKPVSDIKELQIIRQLAAAGAHVDCVIIKNESFRDLTTATYDLPETRERLSALKCMAALIANSHKIPYAGRIPPTLEPFIQMHRPIVFYGSVVY